MCCFPCTVLYATLTLMHAYRSTFHTNASLQGTTWQDHILDADARDILDLDGMFPDIPGDLV